MERYEYMTDRFFGFTFGECQDRCDSAAWDKEGWKILYCDVTTYKDGEGNPATSLFVVYRRKDLNK